MSEYCFITHSPFISAGTRLTVSLLAVPCAQSRCALCHFHPAAMSQGYPRCSSTASLDRPAFPGAAIFVDFCLECSLFGPASECLLFQAGYDATGMRKIMSVGDACDPGGVIFENLKCISKPRPCGLVMYLNPSPLLTTILPHPPLPLLPPAVRVQHQPVSIRFAAAPLPYIHAPVQPPHRAPAVLQPVLPTTFINFTAAPCHLAFPVHLRIARLASPLLAPSATFVGGRG